jgi:hypothetical protein
MATQPAERIASRDSAVAVASPEERLAVSPVDGHDETLPNAGNAPPDTPSRRKGVFVMLAAVACTVFGAKLITISTLGSPMPLTDQWKGEAAALYAPYLNGTLSFADLLAPHNGHRILLTRMLTLMHLELAGEWNTRLEMILCAILHTALITWLTALLMRLIAPQRQMLLACFVALLFALPIGFENTLLGFNFHFYLTSLFGVAALVAFAAARPFSLRWFLGLSAAVLSYLSFAAGVATFLAAGAIVGLQLATNTRKRCARELASVVVMASIAAALVLWLSSGVRPMTTPWTFIEGLVLATAVIAPALVPTVWFCQHSLARRPAISDRAWVAVGIAGWVVIQVVLLAYGRGNEVQVSRYMDLLLPIYPVGLVAVSALADKPPVTRLSRYAGRGAVAWVFIVTMWIAVGGYAHVLAAIEWNKSARQQVVNVQAYFATNNVDRLKARGSSAWGIDTTYPNPQRLARILQDPAVRTILPPVIRPADADNAEARNRMWLRGALADVTAAAVHALLAIGPVLLALGAALFFAAGARRSFRPLRGSAPMRR